MSNGYNSQHNQEERVRWQHSIHTNAARDGRGTGCTDIARQQHQQDIVMLDSVNNDTGRWRLLGTRERVRLIQEWITWETRQDISDAKDDRRQEPGCGNHNHFSSRRAWWDYQTRIQEGWSEWIATWISEAEVENDLTCVESVQGVGPQKSRATTTKRGQTHPQ